MKNKSQNYNLLVEPWIPVLMTDGKMDRVGIKEAFARAASIREIASSNPMDRVAIVRFLLALLYWCKGNPTDDSGDISGHSFPANWFFKLDDYRDHFNLFGEGRRFYQDRDAKRPRPVTDLIQEIPTGNNFWHFRHSTDKTDGLCAACCATGLLRLPLFSVSGLPDLKAGINGTPPIYVVPWGMSLRATLCTNWMTTVPLGEPAWIKGTIQLPADQEVPLLTGLTLLSRKVWLHEPSGPPGMCQSCGVKQTSLIRTCESQTAGKQENNLWNDRHVVYFNETPRKSAKAADLTAARKFRMDRPWPNLIASIVETGKFAHMGMTTSILIVGFATDKAKNIDVWERTLIIPSSESIQPNAVSLLQHWHDEGGRLEKEMGIMVRSKDGASASIAAIRPHIEDKVSSKVAELITQTGSVWERAPDEYSPMINAVAGSLFPGFTTEAARRRQQFACLSPDMRLSTETRNETHRTIGDGK